jgi:hypothetical protein
VIWVSITSNRSISGLEVIALCTLALRSGAECAVVTRHSIVRCIHRQLSTVTNDVASIETMVLSLSVRNMSQPHTLPSGQLFRQV